MTKQTDQAFRIIHFHIHRPDRSLFKTSKRTKAQSLIIKCEASRECSLFNRGQCALLSPIFAFQKPCPYGVRLAKSGYTVMSKKYHKWIHVQEKKYSGIPSLKYSEKMGRVKDYIYLPYSYMEGIDLGWIGSMIPAENFTADTIVRLFRFKPKDMWFNKEILSYQKETVPQFLKHLREEFPEIFKQSAEKDNDIFILAQKHSSVGRIALLSTTTPGAEPFKDATGRKWAWDGNNLIANGKAAAFPTVGEAKTILTPYPLAEIKITDDSQVNDNTVFVN